jgi:hypothetical protein
MDFFISKLKANYRVHPRLFSMVKKSVQEFVKPVVSGLLNRDVWVLPTLYTEYSNQPDFNYRTNFKKHFNVPDRFETFDVPNGNNSNQ